MFINQYTPCRNEPERLVHKIVENLRFRDVVKVKSRYYEETVRVISTDAKNTADFEITELHMQSMQKMIRRNPSYWLWTHKRWKHKHLYQKDKQSL